MATLRRLHHEALKLLSNVLTFDPLNCIALTMRIQNFMSLANYTQNFEAANLLYDRGIIDGEYAEANCIPDPAFYAIYSLLYWSKSVKIIKLLRRGLLHNQIGEWKSEVFRCLKKAEHLAKTGMVAAYSGTDNRCSFWLAHYFTFMQLLTKRPELLTDQQIPFEDDNVYTEAIKAVFESVGWITSSSENKSMEEFLYRSASMSIDNYLNSISADSHYANAAYSASTILWDFTEPLMKPFIIDHVLNLLNIAHEKAENLKKNSLGVYICTEIQSPNEFIIRVNKAKQAVENIKNSGNYNSGMKLSLLNLDNDTKETPITLDLIKREGDAS